MTEAEGYDPHLPAGRSAQDDLIAAVRGRQQEHRRRPSPRAAAVDMSRFIDRVPAIVETWYAGQEGGTALAQLVAGRRSARRGKLPVTFEARLGPTARSFTATTPRPSRA